MTELRLSDERAHLRADCSRCAGLCCVAPPFAASADFAFDKPAGQPCRHLRADFRCVSSAERERYVWEQELEGTPFERHLSGGILLPANKTSSTALPSGPPGRSPGWTVTSRSSVARDASSASTMG